MLLEKDKLDAIEVLICKALVALYVRHDEFLSENSVLKKYNEMKEEIKIPGTSAEYTI